MQDCIALIVAYVAAHSAYPELGNLFTGCRFVFEQVENKFL